MMLEKGLFTVGTVQHNRVSRFVTIPKVLPSNSFALQIKAIFVSLSLPTMIKKSQNAAFYCARPIM